MLAAQPAQERGVHLSYDDAVHLLPLSCFDESPSPSWPRTPDLRAGAGVLAQLLEAASDRPF
jgi:hypothetical protein